MHLHERKHTVEGDVHHSCLFYCRRAPQFLLHPAAGLLHSLLYLHPASVPGSEERRSHAHRPQSADDCADVTGMLRSLQLRPPGQVDTFSIKQRTHRHMLYAVIWCITAGTSCSDYFVLCRYSRDGTGIPLMGSLAECMLSPFDFLTTRRNCESVEGRLIIHVLFVTVFLSSLGHGVPGVHAVHVAESVHGLDSESRQEASVQASSVGAVPSLHGYCCGRSCYPGGQHQHMHFIIISVCRCSH